MGKKTYSAAERARVQQAAAQRRKDKEMKQYTALVIALVCIVAAVLLFGFIRDAVTTPAKIRDLNAIGENWIVIDTDNRTSTNYHHPATFDVPAGYIRSDYSTFSDGIQQDILVEAEDVQASVARVYVSAASELTAKEYMQRLIEYSASALNGSGTVETGEPFSAVIAGKEAQCLYLRYAIPAEDGSEQAYGCLFTAFDAPRNVCVYASISGAYTTPENVQTADLLLAESEALLAGLTIVK